MQSIIQDVRYAVRLLRKSPGFAVTVVAVLALGIGANIAVFTLLNGILLRPLPYTHPDRVVTVELSGPMPYYSLTYANMLQLRDAVGQNLETGAVMCCGHNASIVGPGGRVQVVQQEVTSGLPRMLGVRLLTGRMFRDDENDPGKNRVLLIGEDVWRNLYHSDAHVVGQALTIRKQTYIIVGVMPAHLAIPPYDDAMQVWSPAALTIDTRSQMTPKVGNIGTMYARLPAGMTVAQLAADMSRTQALIAREIPDGELPGRIKVTDYRESISQGARKPLLLLYAVVFGIWMLACLNVTSLMLTRAVARSREQAVRAALGASARRLVQQAVVESLMLSGMGALAGLLLGQGAIKLLWHQIARKLPLSSAVQVDWRVVAFLAGLTLTTAIIAGVFPALRAMRHDVRGSLHGVSTTSSSGAIRMREGLVVAQLSLTLVFLVGAGLFLRTINALRMVPLGFAQQNVLTGGIVLNGTGWNENDSGDKSNIVTGSYLPLLERMKAIPGVRAAALSSVLPLRTEFAVTVSGAIDHKEAPRGKGPSIDARLASPGLVDALGIPMLHGRFFTEDDTSSSPPVVVVNQAFVDRFLPGLDPVGHAFGMDKKRFAEMRIVGVIGDVKQTSVTDSTRPEIYFCLAQMVPGTPLYGIATAFIQVALRGRIPADMLRTQFDKVLHEIAPDATTTDVKTIHEAVEDSFGGETLIAQLLETFAALALMIASVGLYGLLSFVVAQRTREIGIRVALGASQLSILYLVLRRALLLVGLGLALGGTLAWFATTLARGYIYGVQAHDGLTFAVVTLVLAAASLLAAWLPARRAASVDPILALRSE